jgi:hypothetical protein
MARPRSRAGNISGLYEHSSSSASPRETKSPADDPDFRWLLEHGRAVPLGADKKPRLRSVKRNASKNLAQIRAWAKKKPGCRWAIHIDEDSDLVVIDCEAPAKGKGDGEATLAELERQYGPLPLGPVARTVSGGTHRYGRCPRKYLPLVKNWTNPMGTKAKPYGFDIRVHVHRSGGSRRRAPDRSAVETRAYPIRIPSGIPIVLSGRPAIRNNGRERARYVIRCGSKRHRNHRGTGTTNSGDPAPGASLGASAAALYSKEASWDPWRADTSYDASRRVIEPFCEAGSESACTGG